MADNSTVQALRKASAGLTYMSETDAPWEVFSWSPAGELSADAVRKLGGHPSAAPVTEQPVGEFFAPLVEEQDWYGDEERAVAGSYRSLLTVIKSRLSDPKVFKVGDRRVTIYVLGGAKDGRLGGLKTTAVET